MPVIKHLRELAIEEPSSQKPPQRPQGRVIFDLVPQYRSPLAIIDKSMSMIPPGEWPRHLFVREQSSFNVLRVLRDPMQF